MAEIGYKLSSEEHVPLDLVRNAAKAESVGFTFAMISDHYHPWTDKEGQSPFVWAVIGGISQVTSRLQLCTGVTCPTIRIHPAIIAQAAATAGVMLPGRFILGLGTGENLNEHILGDRWPPADIRLEMLEEAVEIIRLLWMGEMQDYHGFYYVVENARIYTLPDTLPSIFIASEAEMSAETAGRVADGLITSGGGKEVAEIFMSSGGEGKPCYSEISVCWAEDEAQARRTAYKYWPISANAGELNRELPTPAHYQQLASMVDEDAIADKIVCGPNKEEHTEKIRKVIDAGYDHICIHQIGPDQEGFMDFYRRKVLPEFRK
jgi:coenzyme F420-dependent glucose-6-phosphate dehydrogenase